ncbi:hypothetical protein FRB96_008798 [Tulasnella sp. 330]|nr:hypothetical protein FRB96_008798 [Tulasnella sp. 330]KAG8884155.1 hypothetical protein FRB97_005138 [Tulasnella sp. 331]KAG8890169.1 hypothetical protein FRB98_000497 [Tulasnella sp. 332]
MDTLRSLASTSKGFFDIIGTRIYPDIVVPVVDLTGKRVIVTGANTGLGLEIATQFARQGAEVYILCRDAAKAKVARDAIVEETGNDRVFIEIVDFSSIASERDFIRRWGQRNADQQCIDILVSNAGIAISTKSTTKDGFELCYQVNMLSHYALIVPLFQLGFMASDARVVLMSSSGMYSSKKLDPEDLNSNDVLASYKEGETTNFEKLWTLSGRSKAGQVVFARELQARLNESKRWKNVSVSACHPGAVKTGIYQRPTGIAYNPVMARWAQTALDTVGISVQQGATTAIYLATQPEPALPEVRGKYWERCGWKWTPAWMEDAELRTALWKRWGEDSRIRGRIE